MTKPAEFPGYRECDKIPGVDVAAYAEIALDPENPTGIALDSTWGYNRLDLESIVKAGETVTHLELAPTNNPTVLRYSKEDGGIDCVPGDELSRIISMQLLKDVDQSQPIINGAAYIYNETTGKFEPFEIVSAIGDINALINRLQAQITALGNRITDIENLKRSNSSRQRVGSWLPGAGRREKWREIDQKVQSFSYKMNESQ